MSWIDITDWLTLARIVWVALWVAVLALAVLVVIQSLRMGRNDRSRRR